MIEMQKQKNVEDIVRNFVTEISALMEQQSEDNMRQKLASILGAELPVARKPVKASASSAGGKRNYTRKPCPVPGCSNQGAPRYHWICKEHGREFTKEGKSGEEKANAFIAQAEKPGGLWYVESRETQVKRGPGRPKKVQTEKTAEKAATAA